MKRIAAALAVACALVVTAVAGATSGRIGSGAASTALPPITYGVADDGGKYADDGGAWFDQELKGANLTEERWTLSWDPNHPSDIGELPFLVRAAPQAQRDGIRVELALYGRPASAHDPAAFCSWAQKVAQTVKGWGIHDYIVWNEPNTALYWSPQDSSAPTGYEALLAQCYDAIHAGDSQANVIGFGLSPRSNGPTQTAPIPFIKAVGAVYKASGRTAPIMDQMSIHPYPNPNSPTDTPDVGYKNTDFYGIPNFDRVKQALYDAFNGSGQPTTVNGLTFVVDEVGWQTDTTQYSQYVHDENVKVVSEAQQAADMKQAVERYFACDPSVATVNWFLLVDEKYRDGKNESGMSVGGGWQSGLLTAGGKGVSTPKQAYSALAPDLAAGRGACTGSVVKWSPAGAGTGGQIGGGKPSSGQPSVSTAPSVTDLAALGALFTLQQHDQNQQTQLMTAIQGIEQQASTPAPAPPDTKSLVTSAQLQLKKLLALLQQPSQPLQLMAELVQFLNGQPPTQSDLVKLINLILKGRVPASATAARHVAVAAAQAQVGAGSKTSVTLKALHGSAKVAAGQYYLVLVARSTSDPTQTISVATLAKTVKATAKPRAKPGKKKH